jgi:hypothetical protein
MLRFRRGASVGSHCRHQELRYPTFRSKPCDLIGKAPLALGARRAQWSFGLGTVPYEHLAFWGLHGALGQVGRCAAPRLSNLRPVTRKRGVPATLRVRYGRVLVVGIDRSRRAEITKDCNGVGTSRIQIGDDRRRKRLRTLLPPPLRARLATWAGSKLPPPPLTSLTMPPATPPSEQATTSWL